MPIEYEFDAVDCPLRMYSSKWEYEDDGDWGVEVIIQPESGIEQFDKRVAEYVYEVFTEDLAATLDVSESPSVVHHRDPHQIEVFVVARNSEVSVVDVGEVVGELLLAVEQRVAESVDVDNGDFNLGAASVLYDESR